ncbi:DUF742 domain-containing protein [Streptomyces smyrnaeus]|uniref:DUF742 domain-containing protein n=1 Tax=Streptomyces TaxID=1883 RepID=UPI000C183FEF|nr:MULTISPECIES: DUF742 domain-containing protein [unclassified Streptomyces]MBQ0866658.1 DUF742 domain-containing protein [Streptomyces sp. RK75]MBQ1122514.1 DUF742 domain-containing protein [Streptomyces sp. B15]MBQ1158578.1 DUF742 domain-containing protein [Streptomyces sp. A73]
MTALPGAAGPGSGDEPWLDDDAGRLVRPYTVCEGRTKPSAPLDLLTMVRATGVPPDGYLGPEHTEVLRLCGGPVSVAEIAATIRQPATVTKVVLSDLVDCGAVATRGPVHLQQGSNPNDREVLEAVLDGLRRRL